MLTKPRFLLSLSKKLDSFTTAKITIMIIMIKIIVITMLIIIIIMIIKWNLEVVNQHRTLCVPKKKKTKLFNLYLCFFYRFLRSSIFTFVLFFFRCRNKVLYMNIHRSTPMYWALFHESQIYIYMRYQCIRDLWQLHGSVFLRLIFYTIPDNHSWNFLRRGNRIIINLIFVSFGSFFWHLRWPTNVNKEVYLSQKHS